MIKQAQSVRYSDPGHMQQGHRASASEAPLEHWWSTGGPPPRQNARVSTSGQQPPQGQRLSSSDFQPQSYRTSTEYNSAPERTGGFNSHPTPAYHPPSTRSTQHRYQRSSGPPLDYQAATMANQSQSEATHHPNSFNPVPDRERTENLRIYQDLVGITTPPGLADPHTRPSLRSYLCFTRPVKNTGYYQSIMDEELKATIWYHSSTWGVNLLLALQIAIAASLTALGASSSNDNRRGLAITLLAAVNTAVATVLAYTKAKGMPMRALVYRNDLRRLLEHIRYTERLFELGINEGPAGADPALAAAHVKASFDQVQEMQEKQEADAEIGAMSAHPASKVGAPPSPQSPRVARTSRSTAPSGLPVGGDSRSRGAQLV